MDRFLEGKDPETGGLCGVRVPLGVCLKKTSIQNFVI